MADFLTFCLGPEPSALPAAPHPDIVFNGLFVVALNNLLVAVCPYCLLLSALLITAFYGFLLFWATR